MNIQVLHIIYCIRVVGLEERVVVAIRVVTKGGSSGGGGHVGQLVVIG